MIRQETGRWGKSKVRKVYKVWERDGKTRRWKNKQRAARNGGSERRGPSIEKREAERQEDKNRVQKAEAGHRAYG